MRNAKPLYLCSVEINELLIINIITMKNLIIATLMLSGTVLFAQQEDKMVTTKVKKEVKVNDKGQLYTNKVMVKTEKTKKMKWNPNQKHQLNQARIETPVTVNKVVMIDNDMDPFYDKSTKVKYYKFNDMKYNFLVNKNSLVISYEKDNKKYNSARAIKSRYNRHYIVNGDDFNGIGYFNKDNDFVIEYYDKETEDTNIAVFEDFKM